MSCLGNRLSRRNILTVGALGGLGLTLSDFFRMQSTKQIKSITKAKRESPRA